MAAKDDIMLLLSDSGNTTSDRERPNRVEFRISEEGAGMVICSPFLISKHLLRLPALLAILNCTCPRDGSIRLEITCKFKCDY